MSLNDDIRALSNAINRLNSELGVSRNVVWDKTGTVPISEPITSSSADINKFGTVVSELVDSLRNIQKEFANQNREAKKQNESFLDSVGRYTALFQPIAETFKTFSKYYFDKPVQMMGGQQGVIARGALERQTDAGNTVLNVASAISALMMFSPTTAPIGIGATVALQFGKAAGLGKLLGLSLDEKAINAAAMEDIARMSQESLPNFREGARNRVRIERTELINESLGYKAGETLAGRLGLNQYEIIQFFENAVKTGGIRGVRAMAEQGGVSAIADMTEKGIYGTFEQVSIGTLLGSRAGISLENLQSVARRTGWQLDEVGQAAMSIRASTLMYGENTARNLLNFVANTSLSEFGIPTAYAAMSSAASSAQSAGSANEAAEMLQFSAFKRAKGNENATFADVNPGQ